jgi:hypothetical protein
MILIRIIGDLPQLIVVVINRPEKDNRCTGGIRERSVNSVVMLLLLRTEGFGEVSVAHNGAQSHQLSEAFSAGHMLLVN